MFRYLQVHEQTAQNLFQPAMAKFLCPLEHLRIQTPALRVLKTKVVPQLFTSRELKSSQIE